MLARAQKDEAMQRWFGKLAEQVDALDIADETVAGRKIQGLLRALEDVEQFENIDTSMFVKEYLGNTRAQLRNMIRIVNVNEEVGAGLW